MSANVLIVLLRAGRRGEAEARYARDGLTLGPESWFSLISDSMAAEVAAEFGDRELAMQVYGRRRPYAGRPASAAASNAVWPVDWFLAVAAAAAGEKAVAAGHADDALNLCAQWGIERATPDPVPARSVRLLNPLRRGITRRPGTPQVRTGGGATVSTAHAAPRRRFAGRRPADPVRPTRPAPSTGRAAIPGSSSRPRSGHARSPPVLLGEMALHQGQCVGLLVGQMVAEDLPGRDQPDRQRRPGIRVGGRRQPIEAHSAGLQQRIDAAVLGRHGFQGCPGAGVAGRVDPVQQQRPQPGVLAPVVWVQDHEKYRHRRANVCHRRRSLRSACGTTRTKLSRSRRTP